MTEPLRAGGAELNEVTKLVSTIESQVRHDYPPPHMKRDAHTKMHGCVQAEFHVDPDLPEELRYGVFANVGQTYRAWVRFSNGFGFQHDLEFDTRGMAVKLLGVHGERLPEAEGETQDFLLATHDAFFMPNVDGYAKFATVTHRHPLVIGWFFVRRGMCRSLWALTRSALVLAKSPLAIRYFSQTPYKLGPHVVKLQARPKATAALTRALPSTFWFGPVAAVFSSLAKLLPLGIKKPLENIGNFFISRDSLRKRMMSYLVDHDASFDLLVQCQQDPHAMPIDDATVSWNQRLAPFRRVGAIEIPRQIFWPHPSMPERVRVATTQMAELGENMSFNPWHGLVDHEPLGAINRARRIVYVAIANLRRDANGVRHEAPTTAAYDELRAIVQHRAVHPERGTASPGESAWRDQPA
jgi:hypothetical protein